MNRYHSTPAIVINKKTLRETDLLITLLTPQLGKIIAKASGAKSIKSSRLGNLQLGNVITAHLYQKNDQTWISETQNIIPFLLTSKSSTQLNLLFYFLEILNLLIAENQQIDSVYPISLKIIDAINHNSVIQFIDNEIKFISVLGFGIPDNVKSAYAQKDYKSTQKYLKLFFESLVERHLESNKLFK